MPICRPACIMREACRSRAPKVQLARSVPNREPRETHVKILYFAWVRQKIGVSEEDLDVPSSVTTVSDLIDFLKSRSPGYTAAFHDLRALRVAVNQQHSGFDARIGPDD